LARILETGIQQTFLFFLSRPQMHRAKVNGSRRRSDNLYLVFATLRL
jgi:hypothetical protein